VPPVVPYATVDECDYLPDGGWPATADGLGEALERLGLGMVGQYAESWQAHSPTPGDASALVVPEVVARWAFYNNSAYDGSDAGTDPRDDAAVATDKTALLPGQVASFANYTSFDRGLNGIFVDLAGLPDGITPEAGDFVFRMGNDNDPAAWPLAPDPAVTVRADAGENGADRVTIRWEDRALRNRWVQITVHAGRLGLLQDDVFYFGNAVAEAGNSAAQAQVTATDLLLARNNPRNFLHPAAVDFAYDYNRDQRVNATDVLLARNNQTNFLTALRLLDLTDIDGG